MSDKNQDTFLFNIMTDHVFRRVTGQGLRIDHDIRRGEYILILQDDLHVDIPSELKSEPGAIDKYAVDAVRYMLKNGEFCECNRLNPMSERFGWLGDDYRRQWHMETHGTPLKGPTWQKRHAMEKVGARIIDAARSNDGSLDGAVAMYNDLDAEPDHIDAARIKEIVGE